MNKDQYDQCDEHECDGTCGLGSSDLCPYDKDVEGKDQYCLCCDACRESCADNI